MPLHPGEPKQHFEKAEQTLRNLTLFRTLLDHSNDAIEVTDPETLRFLDVNQTACVELGYSREELLSMTVYDIDPKVNEGVKARIEEKLGQIGFAIFESLHRRKDGSTFPVEVNLRRVRLDREYNVVVSRDITQRKQAEERLKESEAKFSTAFRRSPIALTLMGKDHRYIDVSEAFERVSGWRRDEVIGRTPFDLGIWVNPSERVEITEQVLGHNPVRRREFQARMKDGTVRTFLGTSEAIVLNGEPCMIQGAEDITERKQAEEALRLSEERFRVALKHSPISVFNQDRDLRYTWMYNPVIQGPEPGHLGKTPRELYGPEEGERISEVRRRVLETGMPVRQEVQITDRGRKHYFDTTIEPVLDSTGA